jgi:hypothetical protein
MNELIISSLNNAIISSEYKEMISKIEEVMPQMMEASTNFYKSHSQYMGVMLDVTAITPIRRVKHILAEINRTKNALEEAYIKQKKNEVELKRLKAKLDGSYVTVTALENVLDKYERELIEIEILEKEIQAKNITNSVQGAIRKLSFFTTQYKSVMKMIGKDMITEEDYEREEDRYHIMTAMKQALIAARARGGIIDEGNQIYMFDLGINGGQAQEEILAYLQMENELFKNGKAPTYEMTMNWLEACADKFAGCAKRSAEYRGYTLFDDSSLITRNNNSGE